MISILIWLLVLLVALYIANMIVKACNLTPQVQQIAMAIVGLIFLLILLSQLGVLGGGMRPIAVY